MIPEFGHFALIVALSLAVVLTVVPLWGAWQRNVAAMALAPSLATGAKPCSYARARSASATAGGTTLPRAQARPGTTG